MQVQSSVRVNATPEQVWSYVVDPTNWAQLIERLRAGARRSMRRVGAQLGGAVEASPTKDEVVDLYHRAAPSYDAVMRIYERLGFETIGEADVGPMHTWCMFWPTKETA